MKNTKENWKNQEKLWKDPEKLQTFLLHLGTNPVEPGSKITHSKVAKRLQIFWE